MSVPSVLTAKSQQIDLKMGCHRQTPPENCCSCATSLWLNLLISDLELQFIEVWQSKLPARRPQR
jgi:hypothetical protein